MSWNNEITDTPERLQPPMTSQATPSPADSLRPNSEGRSNRKRQSSDLEDESANVIGAAVRDDDGAAVPPTEVSNSGSPPKRARRLFSSTKRCEQCKRKLKLAMTFACRCGFQFCGDHRYAESHGCSFDYRELGRKEIEKNNPVIRPEKLTKL